MYTVLGYTVSTACDFVSLCLQQQLTALGGLQPGVDKLKDSKHQDADAIEERYLVYGKIHGF